MNRLKLMLLSGPVLVCTVAGCAQQLPADLEAGANQLPAIPAIPASPAPGKIESGTTQYVLSAADAVVSQDATMEPGHLRLGSDRISYVIFGINAAAVETKDLELKGTLSGLWAGVSNYETMSWDWLAGPLDAPCGLKLPQSGTASETGDTFLLLLAPPGASADIQLEVVLTPDFGRWNMLVWLAADNDLADYAWSKLNALESAGSDENVTILAGFDIDENEMSQRHELNDQVYFIKVVHDTTWNLVLDGDKANVTMPQAGFDSSDPANVVRFLDWAKSSFPAEHQVLIIDDHGGGWLPGHKFTSADAGRDASWILYDHRHGHGPTDNSGLAAALESYDFDVLCFQACNMAQIEALYEFRNCADWIVASEAMLWEPGFALKEIVQKWEAAFPLDAHDVALLFPQQTYAKNGNNQSLSISVVKTLGIEPLAKTLDQLALALLDGTPGEQKRFGEACLAQDKVEGTASERDLEAILVDYLYRGPSPGARLAAGDVLEQLRLTVGDAIIVDYTGLSGLSIFAPPDARRVAGSMEYYGKTGFAQATHWDELLWCY